MDRSLTDSEKSKHKKEIAWTQRSRKNRLFFLIVFFALVAESVISNKLSELQANKVDYGESYGYAPNPEAYHDAVIQVYSARTRGPKGMFAVHCWIATKRQNADHYIVSQVIGWRGNYVFVEQLVPDKSWYGNEPVLHLDLRGEEYENVIDKIEVAVGNYPWAGDYTIYPGPNSNTFVSWIGKQVPELGLDLPSTAIGKDWRPIDEALGMSSSGTGVQASLLGLVGATAGYQEGLEVYFLGLNFELDLFDMALEIPIFGRYNLWWLVVFCVGWFTFGYLKRKRLEAKAETF